MVGDVLCGSGKILEVSSEISESADREIDGRGLTLFPGVIDPQVHFREPGLEHKEDLFTASCACAKGGVTSDDENLPELPIMPFVPKFKITKSNFQARCTRASYDGLNKLVEVGFSFLS